MHQSDHHVYLMHHNSHNIVSTSQHVINLKYTSFYTL